MSQACRIECISCKKTLMKELDVPFLDLYEAYYLSGRGRGRDGMPALDEISALL
jgi:hypothetical protein